MYFRTFCRAIVWTGLFLGLAASASAEAVRLQWDANTEPGITSYTVAYGTRSGVYGSAVNVGNTTTYTLNLTTPGTYFIAVSASSAAGTSNYSAEVSTVITGAAASNGVLMVDAPAASAVVTSDLLLSGWSADLGAPSGSGIDAIHVYAYPNPGSGAAPVFLGPVVYGTARPDVAAAFGSQFVNSGYSLPIVGLGAGRYDLQLYAHSTVTNAFSLTKGVPITVGAPTAAGPRLSIDVPQTGQDISGALTVAGWAADQRSTTGPGVDFVNVWAYPAPGSGRMPVFLGSASYGISRTDIGAIFGTRFRPSGFEISVVSLPAGLYDVVAIPRSTVSGSFENGRVVRVTIRPSTVVMVDAPAVGATVTRPFVIRGWAVDRRAIGSNGIDAIHVWAYPNPGSGAAPIFLGATATGLSRPDVAAALGGAQFTNAGFTITVGSGLTSGVLYDVAVFAQNHATGAFENATVVRVRIQ